MSPQLFTILELVLTAVPYMIKGSKAAYDVYEAGMAVFRGAVSEGRDPTEAEVEAVRALRKEGYDDFYKDDEVTP